MLPAAKLCDLLPRVPLKDGGGVIGAGLAPGTIDWHELRGDKGLNGAARLRRDLLRSADAHAHDEACRGHAGVCDDEVGVESAPDGDGDDLRDGERRRVGAALDDAINVGVYH